MRTERNHIDLFAGCGGLTLGLHDAGWGSLFAVEKDPMAFETLEANFLTRTAPYQDFDDWPRWLPKKPLDIREMVSDRRYRVHLRNLAGSVDLVAGGPPCQGFSVGGRRDGHDERNLLVYQQLELSALVRPKLILIENVEGITRRFVSKPGQAADSVAQDVIRRLTAMGYHAAHLTLNANEFGVPQFRRRVVIIGVRSRLAGFLKIEDTLAGLFADAATEVRTRLGLGSRPIASVREALHDLANEERVPCPDSPGFESTTYLRADSIYARHLRRGRRTGTIPDSHRFSKHGDGILSLYELAHESQVPGRLSKSFLLANGTKKDKKVLLDPTVAASTITTHPDEFIHYTQPRNVTVREMARLQSFPDDFVFRGRYTINGPRRRFDVARCSQVGNAVPPFLAHGVGLALNELLSAVERSTPKARIAVNAL